MSGMCLSYPSLARSRVPHLMAFCSSSCSWPIEIPNPNSIPSSFHTQTQSSSSSSSSSSTCSHAMEPFSSSSSSSTYASSFNLDFQQPNRLYQQQQQQNFLLPSPSPSPRPLQGPRPTRLKIDKASHKIKKPPAGPAARACPAAAPQPQPQPQPVVIYTVSPKVIRTKPSNFMALVQLLTGVNSSPTAVEAAMAAATPSPSSAFPSPGGALSPAANLAAIEKAQKLPDHHQRLSADDLPVVEQQLDPDGTAAAALLHLPPSLGGILSPNPSALPPLSPCLFSSPDPPAAPELNSLGFLQDMMGQMSPAAVSGRGFGDGSFVLTPLGFSVTPTPPSPLWDFLLNSPQQRNLDSSFNPFYPDL